MPENEYFEKIRAQAEAALKERNEAEERAKANAAEKEKRQREKPLEDDLRAREESRKTYIKRAVDAKRLRSQKEQEDQELAEFEKTGKVLKAANEKGLLLEEGKEFDSKREEKSKTAEKVGKDLSEANADVLMADETIGTLEADPNVRGKLEEEAHAMNTELDQKKREDLEQRKRELEKMRAELPGLVKKAHQRKNSMSYSRYGSGEPNWQDVQDAVKLLEGFDFTNHFAHQHLSYSHGNSYQLARSVGEANEDFLKKYYELRDSIKEKEEQNSRLAAKRNYFEQTEKYRREDVYKLQTQLSKDIRSMAEKIMGLAVRLNESDRDLHDAEQNLEEQTAQAKIGPGKPVGKLSDETKEKVQQLIYNTQAIDQLARDLRAMRESFSWLQFSDKKSLGELIENVQNFGPYFSAKAKLGKTKDERQRLESEMRGLIGAARSIKGSIQKLKGNMDQLLMDTKGVDQEYAALLDEEVQRRPGFQQNARAQEIFNEVSTELK